MSVRATTPQRTYLYRLFSADGSLLYIGISCHVIERFRYHKSWGHSSDWWQRVKRTRIQQYATRNAAELAEARAIVSERPLHNVRRGASRRVVEEALA